MGNDTIRIYGIQSNRIEKGKRIEMAVKKSKTLKVLFVIHLYTRMTIYTANVCVFVEGKREVESFKLLG